MNPVINEAHLTRTGTSILESFSGRFALFRRRSRVNGF